MARVLLAVPPMGAASVPPQLGLGYLASALRSHRHSVEVVHGDQQRLEVPEFVERVLDDAPDVLGLSVVTMAYANTRLITTELRGADRLIRGSARARRFLRVPFGPEPS